MTEYEVEVVSRAGFSSALRQRSGSPVRTSVEPSQSSIRAQWRIGWSASAGRNRHSEVEGPSQSLARSPPLDSRRSIRWWGRGRLPHRGAARRWLVACPIAPDRVEDARQLARQRHGRHALAAAFLDRSGPVVQRVPGADNGAPPRRPAPAYGVLPRSPPSWRYRSAAASVSSSAPPRREPQIRFHLVRIRKATDLVEGCYEAQRRVRQR